MHKALAVVAGAAALFAAAAQSQAALVEDFESYDSTAEMQAVWTPVGGPGVLDTTLNNTPGDSKSFNHTAPLGSGAQHTRIFAGETATAGAPIIFSVDVYDDGTSANKRMFAEIRDASGAGRILGLGLHNSTDVAGGTVTTYHLRQALGNSTTDQYVDIPSTRSVGWHEFTMIVEPSQIRASVDGGSEVIVPFDSDGITYTQARLGGPSGSSSAGGGVNFDNISVAIPEPASLSILALAAGTLIRRRRA